MLTSRSVSAWLLVSALVWTPASSQTLPIVVDKSVPSQRAIVGVGGNGVPIVNIAPPTAAGVSNNRFQQFNVGPSGVVFNNSGATSQSQLVGAIAGNPLLGNGRAAVILNQVTANNPSQLRGMMEVAGHRANVIIANPAGIVCDGCGFLNAHRGTLTTGRPMIGADGGLQGFDVTRGRVSIEGQGLFGKGVDRVDLIARTLLLNAAVWANRLDVVAGPATVGYGDDSVQPKAGEGPAPLVWLDAAALGSMYANSIRLIGTEAGVGVNIGGSLNSLTGTLHLSSEGDLRILPAGQVYGAQGVNLSAGGDLAVLGKATATGEMQLTARQGLRVAGTVATGDTAALGAGSGAGIDAGYGPRPGPGPGAGAGAGITLAGHDIDIGATGKVHSSAALLADARGRLDSAGDVRATGNVALKSVGAMTLAGLTASSAGNVHLQSVAQGIVMSPSARAHAVGALDVIAQGTLLAGGALSAGQSATLRAGGNLENRATVHGNTDVTLTSGGTLVSHGTVVAGQSATLHATSHLAHRGKLEAHAGLKLTTAGTLINGGELWTDQSATLHADRGLQNQGTLSAKTGMTLTSNGTLINSGKLLTPQSATLRAHDNLENHGTLQADVDVTVSTPGALINRGGRVTSAGDVRLDIQGRLDNRDGTIRSRGTLSSGGNKVLNQGGALIGRDLEIKTPGNIDNTSGLIAGNNSLKVNGKTLRNADGVVTSHGVVAIDVGTLKNKRGEVWSGEGSSIKVDRLTGAGKMASRSDIDFESKESLHHTGEISAAGNVSVRITQGDLHQSGTISSGRDATVSAHDVKNDGMIVSAGTTRVRAKRHLHNEELINGVETDLRAPSVENIDRIYGDRIKIETDLLRNGPGAIAAHERIDVGADTFDNVYSEVYSGGDMNLGRRLDATGNAVGKASVVNNRSGLIDVDGNLHIDAETINNLNEHFVSEVVPGTTTRKVYYRRDGTDEKLDADQYWLCNYDKPACSKNYEWVLRSPQRRLLMPSKEEKYNKPQYGPPFPYADHDLEAHAPGRAPIRLPYSPPYLQEISGQNYIPIREVFHDSIDAPIWDVFEVPRPAPMPEPPPAMPGCVFNEECKAKLDAYESAYKAKVAAYEELNKQVYAYNRDFKSRLVESFTIYDVNETVSESRMVSSAPARILAGGNATLRGEILNDKSQIIAGGDLHAVGGSVRNIGATGERHIEASGQVIRTYNGKRHREHDIADYRDTLRIEPIEMAVATYAGNTPKPTGAGSIPGVSPPAVSGPPFGTHSIRVPGMGEVRTVAPPLGLPDSALYNLTLAPDSAYLVTTDDHFIGRQPLVSSDYLFDLLGGKVGVAGQPSTQAPPQPDTLRYARPRENSVYVESFNGPLMLKRLGDAFYEQRLVASQIMAATGQRFIGDYRDNQSQYQALLTAGASFGKQYGLTVGTALTEDQMHHLTSDLVWMVKRDVQLPDGTTQTVLAPQVYLMVQDGDLKGDGTLMAGRRSRIDTGGRVENSGTLAARDAVVVTAQDIVNRDGGTVRASTVGLYARQDLESIGSVITGNDVKLSAGRDINLMSTTGASTEGAPSSKGGRPHAETQRTYIGGVSRIDADTLSIDAGRDVKMQAAAVDIDGDASINAGRDINLLTAHEAYSESVVYGKRNNSRVQHTTDVGTVIHADGNLEFSAGRDMTATAADATADGNLAVEAGRDINLLDGRETSYARDERYEKRRSGWSTVTKHRIDTTESDQSRASTFTGDTVEMRAGRDIRVWGSNVGAQGDLTLHADRDIEIEAGENTSVEDHYRFEKKSGWGATGGLGKGTRQSTTTLEGEGVAYTPSVVGSVDGNVRIDAGGGLEVKGSHFLAKQGDIDATARTIDISTVTATDREKRFHEFKESGFRISVGVPLLDSVENIDRMAQAFTQVDNPIMKALAIGTVGGIAANTAQEVVTSGVSATITLDYGATHNTTTVTRESTDSVGSTVAAGNDLNLVARGDGTHSDITVTGSTLSAGRDAKLDADGDVTLQGAASTSTQHTETRSVDGKIGAGVQVGVSGSDYGYGLVVKGSIAASQGWQEGMRRQWIASSVTGGQNVTLRSGGDTSLRAGMVKGEHIRVTTGGDLLLESLQDEHTYNAENQFASAGFSACWGYCTSSAYASAGLGRMNSDYLSVTDQTGIWAGASGFDIHVGKNTSLKGAVIASDPRAVDADLNRLSTGTLVVEDIENIAKYDAFQVSVGAASGGKGVGATMPGGAVAFDSASSTTRSAISGGTLTIRDIQGQVALTGATVEDMFASLERDTSDTANTLKPIFDREKVQAGLDIATEAARQAGTFLANKAREADAIKKELDRTPEGPKHEALSARYAEASKWTSGGEYQRILTVVLAAASGNVAAGVGQFVQAATVNYLQALGAEKVKSLVADLGGEGSPAQIALHSILACGGAAAQGAKCSAGSLGAASGIVIEKLISTLTETPSNKLNDEAREQRKNVIVNVVAGLSAALDPRNATTAITAARIELENNSLTVQEHQARIQETIQCEGIAPCEKRVEEKYDELSKQRRRGLAECTDNKDCLRKYGEHQELLAGYAQRIGELQNKVEPWTLAEKYEWAALTAMGLLPQGDGGAALRKVIVSPALSEEDIDALWRALANAGMESTAGASLGKSGAAGAKGVRAKGESAGPIRRLDYEAAPYHGKVDNVIKSRAPINGQEALDTSIQVKPTSPRRVGVDYESNEFVVFDKTLGMTYHGHVRAWGDLHPDMQKALQQAGMVDRKGKIFHDKRR